MKKTSPIPGRSPDHTPKKAGRSRRKVISFGAYRLRDLARLEGIHYQTAIARKARGFYVSVELRVKGTGKRTTRYMCAEASRLIRALLELHTAPIPDLSPDLPESSPDPVSPGAGDTF